jgi:NitT/TauT family transport system substrate-binding protein
MIRKHTVAAAALMGAAAVVLSGCASGGGGTTESSAPADADHVTIQLDYQPRGIHSVFYVAEELGYFADQGIVVDDILIGQGSGDTLKLVGTGKGDFGMADLPTLAVARSQEVPVTALAAVNQKSPLAMCTVAEQHKLKTPDDLKGLTVGVQTSGSTYVFYQALLAANGIPKDALTELTVKPPYENYLLTEQVDTVPCYIDAEVPILEEHAGGPGSLSILLGSDWGYDTYGTGVFTSDEMFENNPDLVQRFMNAYVRSLAYVLEHPDEAAQILAGSSPELAKNVELYKKQLEADIANSFTSDDTEELGLGAMTEEKWQATIDLLTEQGVITAPPAANDVFDSSFVENAGQSE